MMEYSREITNVHLPVYSAIEDVIDGRVLNQIRHATEFNELTTMANEFVASNIVFETLNDNYSSP